MGAVGDMLFSSKECLENKKNSRSVLLSLIEEKDNNYIQHQSCISYVMSLLPFLLICLIHFLIRIHGYYIGDLFLIICYLCSFFFFILCYYDSYIIYVLFVLFSYIISLCLHEFAHAYAAYKYGDITMVYKGYLYLDIFNYLDIFHTLIIPIITLLITGFGLPGNLYWLQVHFIRSKFHLSLIYLSGPISDILYILLLVSFYTFYTYLKNNKNLNVQHRSIIFISIATTVAFLVESFILNLCPILGFDGWGIIEPYLPFFLNNLINEEIVYTYLSYIFPLIIFIYFNFLESKYLFFTKITNYILKKILRIDVSHITKGVEYFPTLYSYLKNT
ncbi:site-2 protease S2P, putative [Hepatocystis sp. ex Piliocolobus tephrosceles]|nr:site-2 protease S2P, putative [Hepatocystis sp. ex Piliocolobus tephrosceles]